MSETLAQIGELLDSHAADEQIAIAMGAVRMLIEEFPQETIDWVNDCKDRVIEPHPNLEMLNAMKSMAHRQYHA